jgi:hypothetical protein
LLNFQGVFHKEQEIRSLFFQLSVLKQVT